MSRKRDVVEVLQVVIDALGMEQDPGEEILFRAVNEAIKAHRLAHGDRYNNYIE